MSEACKHDWVRSWLFLGHARCLLCGAIGALGEQLNPAQAAMLGFPSRDPSTGLLRASFDIFRHDVGQPQ